MLTNRESAESREGGHRRGADRSTADAHPRNVIAQYLTPADILLDVDAANKAQVFAEVAERAERRHGVARQTVYEALCAREGFHTTALGRGVAIPHARIKGLKVAIAMFVRTRYAVEFDADDGKPVSQMLVLLVPVDATERHLQVLAEVAQLFCDRGFREQLQEASTADAVYSHFASYAVEGDRRWNTDAPG